MSGSASENSQKIEHESIQALKAKNPGEKDPKKIIIRLAREKVAFAKARSWEGPPFCPKMFTSLFGIRCFEVDHDIGGDGRLLFGKDKKICIEIAKGKMVERQRFTIFHEFAHTLFPDFCRFVPCHQNKTDAISEAEKKFETLCDIAAAEMIMPIENFKKDIEQIKQLNFKSVYTLKNRYNASIDATVRRFVELVDSTPCAVVFLKEIAMGSSCKGLFKVDYMIKNRQFQGYIPPGTPMKWSGSVMEYAKPEISKPVKTTWWLGKYPRTWLAEAAQLPTISNPDYPKLVLLLLPSSYKPLI